MSHRWVPPVFLASTFCEPHFLIVIIHLSCKGMVRLVLEVGADVGVLQSILPAVWGLKPRHKSGGPSSFEQREQRRSVVEGRRQEGLPRAPS